ncbi:MAG: OB-fold domain-containing protein, partial [Pseudomonadales bacterium]|nr:OB-fold domain-containing protein [Pseudomonadales bacterium]
PPFFRNLVPYVVAWIDLDEGPRLLSNVIDVAPEEVSIGQRVELTWEEHDELNIPLFKPA